MNNLEWGEGRMNVQSSMARGHQRLTLPTSQTPGRFQLKVVHEAAKVTGNIPSVAAA